LQGVSGKVLVNTGKGFKVAAADTVVGAGSEVFLADGASATVHFNGANCDVVLAPTNVTRITDEKMCQPATVNTAMFRGTDGDFVITPVNGTYLAPAPAASGAISPLFIAGGIFVVGAAALSQSFLENEDPVTAY
jgi:hypothetical protein